MFYNQREVITGLEAEMCKMKYVLDPSFLVAQASRGPQTHNIQSC